MPEAAHLDVSAFALRVAIRAEGAADTASLAQTVRALGHEICSSEVDVALVRGDVDLSADVPAVVLGGRALVAAGCLPEDASMAQIDAALRAVAAGLLVRPRLGPRFAAATEIIAPSPLSPRELEILIALSEGLSNKAIARRFDISQHTVKFHLESVFRKLGVATRAEAVARGLRGGLVHL
ncbi:MAG: helix-turn-helix domain-containing protein [Rhizomicrobium sp.]